MAQNTPYSARPSSLTNPVPGKQAQEDAQDEFASARIPSIAATPDEFAAAQIPETPQSTQIPADQFAPEPGFAQANVDQLSNFITRVQTGLAANDQEKINALSKKFGPENVTTKKVSGSKAYSKGGAVGGGEETAIYFRKSNKDKFQRLDPATLEVVNDLLPDFAREIVTEGAQLPATIGGGLAGGPVGAGLARAASYPFANIAVDKIAELSGVPQDETRSHLVEGAVGATMEAALPIAGAALIKRLPGTAAYQAAKAAGQKEIVALSHHSQEVAKSVFDLAEQGRTATVNGDLVGIPESNVSLMGHQLNPDNPILARFANVAALDPRFLNLQNQHAQDWGKLLENTFSEIALRNGKGPLKSERLAESITNAVTDLQKAEGQAIGQFRSKAMANLKNQRVQLPPEITQRTEDLLQEFGFIRQTKTDKTILSRPFKNPILNETQQMYKPAQTVTRQTWKMPNDIRPLVGKLGLNTTGEVRAVINNLNELAKGLPGGINRGVSITDLDRLRNSTGTLSDSLFNTKAGGAFGALSGDLRKTFRNVIGQGLSDDTERKAFNSAMDDFSALKTNVGVIKNALVEDASAKAIVKNFFTGAENIQKIEAIKKISPESFSALKEEWINQMLTEFRSRESKTGFKIGRAHV